jgi:hypothetical protein
MKKQATNRSIGALKAVWRWINSPSRIKDPIRPPILKTPFYY